MPTSDLRLADVPTPKGKLRLPYRMERRKGLRHLRVTVDQANQVTLKIPYGISEAHGVAFLQAQGEWLEQMLGRPPKEASLLEVIERKLAISAWGERVPVQLVRGDQGPSWSANAADDALATSTLFSLFLRADLNPEIQVKGILRSMGKAIIPIRVHQLATAHDITISKLSVRDQRTRWGSCSETGSISLNWRLILLPPELHDHVILHELAHRLELNHSQRFWDALARLDPHWKAHDERLTRMSGHVMLLGR